MAIRHRQHAPRELMLPGLLVQLIRAHLVGRAVLRAGDGR
jgi:hypothetical protein